MSAGKNKPVRKKTQVDERQKPRIAHGSRPGGAGATPRRARTFTPPSADGKVVVQLGQLDISGPWCLSKITAEDHVALLQRIKGVESMTMRELFPGGGDLGVDYDVADIPNKDAEARLLELQYDDETQISRIRVSGTGRLFGFRRAERFYALWWDPHHEIWPSRLKHT